MKITPVLLLILKIILLTIVMFILFIIGTSLVGFGPENMQTMNEADAAAEQGMAALNLLVVCGIDVLILVWFILRSRLSGFHLVLVTALLYYSIKTFMSQIEAWYFMSNITPEMLPKLFLMSVPVALFFPLIAVPILGKFRKDHTNKNDQKNQLLMSAVDWIWKTALLAVVVYPLLYFGFGYFIAWRNPELRAFYHGTDPGNIFAHMANVFSTDPWLYFFQILRGLIWVALAVIIIRSMRDSAFKMALFVAIIFSLLMNDSLLIPNPLMPSDIRWTHFIETTSSNFIWGWLVVTLLVWHPKRRLNA